MRHRCGGGVLCCLPLAVFCRHFLGAIAATVVACRSSRQPPQGCSYNQARRLGLGLVLDECPAGTCPGWIAG